MASTKDEQYLMKVKSVNAVNPLLVAHRATYVVDGRFFGHFFLEGGRDCVHTCESCTATTR